MIPDSFRDDVTATMARLLVRACPGVERPGLLVALSGGADSVALLLARVRAFEPVFDVTPSNAEAISGIVRRLDQPRQIEHLEGGVGGRFQIEQPAAKFHLPLDLVMGLFERVAEKRRWPTVRTGKLARRFSFAHDFPR